MNMGKIIFEPVNISRDFLTIKQILIQAYWERRNTANINTKTIRMFEIDTYVDNMELVGPYCHVSIAFAIFSHSEFTLKQH